MWLGLCVCAYSFMILHPYGHHIVGMPVCCACTGLPMSSPVIGREEFCPMLLEWVEPDQAANDGPAAGNKQVSLSMLAHNLIG